MISAYCYQGLCGQVGQVGNLSSFIKERGNLGRGQLKDKEIFTNHFDLHHGSVFLEQLPSSAYVSAVVRAHFF